MAEQFRPPKTVLAETELPASMTAREVLSLRTAGGITGEWAERIASQLEARAAIIKETNVEHLKNNAEEPAEVAPILYGYDADYLADKVMAADAAMDAAQTLLETYEDKDATIAQAYYLICAADSALGDAIECMGLSDPDDELSEGESPAEEAEEMMETNSADPEVEARRSLIATADKRDLITEVRATRDGGELRVSGYAAMWDREADGLPFKEVIKRGAFARSLERGDDVFLLVNHDTDQLPLGRRSAGTLVLEEDEVGLHIDAILDPSNPRAAELGSALERGDVDKMSFAFRIAGKDGETRTEDGTRELRNLDLFEVSVVTWPAYSDTTVGLREAAPAEDLALRARLLRAKLAHQDIK